MPRPRRRPDVSKSYIEIADDIERRIHEGEFPPGSQLPSSTELGFFYKVGLTTINNAVRILRDRDLIYSRSGLGKFVMEDDSEEE
jgi:GntR family transcriptional regulator